MKINTCYIFMTSAAVHEDEINEAIEQGAEISLQSGGDGPSCHGNQEIPEGGQPVTVEAEATNEKEEKPPKVEVKVEDTKVVKDEPEEKGDSWEKEKGNQENEKERDKDKENPITLSLEETKLVHFFNIATLLNKTSLPYLYAYASASV